MPRLYVDIEARFASVQDGLAKIDRDLGKFGSNLERSFGAAKGALTGLLGALSVGAFANFAREAIASAAALDDLAEATGASVEGLSKLVDIARIGGGDIGQVETALIQLNKALAKTDDESKGAAEAFKAVGLSAEQLRRSSPDQAIEQVARAFGQFEDSAGKTAAAIAIFGRNGAQLLPLLKDINENLDRGTSVTKEQAAAAEALDKSWNKLIITSSNLVKQSILNWVTFLQGGEANVTIDQLRARAEKLRGDLRSEQTGIGAQKLSEELIQVEQRIERMAAQANQLKALTFTGPKDDANKSTKGSVAAQRETLDLLDETVRLARLAQDELADLARADEEATDQRLSDARRLNAQLEDEYELIGKVRQAAKDPLGDFIAQHEDAWAAMENTNDLAAELGLTFTSAFEDAVIAGKKFSDVLRALGQDILRIVARKTVTEPIGNLITGALGSLFGGFRAEGGSVTPGNAYVIGERGPELFVPRQAGTVVPNGGATSVTLNISTGVASTVRAEILNLLPAIQQATVAAVADARLRGATV